MSLLRSLVGRPPGGVFEIFEEEAIASASIAQVHKAKLWPRIGPDGTPEKEEQWVAVKIQKPDVSRQMGWDFGAYRTVMWLFENVAFDLPVYFVEITKPSGPPSTVSELQVTGHSRCQFRRTSLSFRDRLNELYRHLIFQVVMLSIDITFYTNKLRKSLEIWRRRLRAWCGLGVVMSQDFEEEMERQVRIAAKDYFGVEIGENTFVG